MGLLLKLALGPVLALGGAGLYLNQVLGAPIRADNVDSRSAQICQAYGFAVRVNETLHLSKAPLPDPKPCSCIANTLIRTNGAEKTADVFEGLRQIALKDSGFDRVWSISMTKAQVKEKAMANANLIENAARNCRI